jgi:hypothetical protein
MTFAAMLVFGISLALIVLLFVLKRIEIGRGARFGERFRASADVGALRVKGWLEMSEWYLEQTPWFIGAITRYGVHVGALSFARIARTSAEYAHGLADLVSHKHRFERRETKSEYLKLVSDLPRRTPEPVAVAERPAPAPEPVAITSEPEQEQAPVVKPVESKPMHRNGKKRRSKNGK